jgi:RHS repeat-associated protein
MTSPTIRVQLPDGAIKEEALCWAKYGYGGKHGSSDSGMDHAQFRQYHNWYGRWMSPDPYSGSYDLSNPQSLNRYTYAMNNPMVFTDPGGLFTDPNAPINLCYFVNCLSGISGPLNPTSVLRPTGPGWPTVSSFISHSRPGASNPQPQQPKKPPCSPATRIGGAVKAFDGLQRAGAAFTTAGIHFVAGGLLVGAGCGEPTPFEPVTCLASGFGAASLWSGGGVLGYLGVNAVKDGVIPGIEQAVTHLCCSPYSRPQPFPGASGRPQILAAVLS